MKGFILVRDDPYFAVTGEDGTFEIKNVPVGKHNFRLKHADTRYIEEATVNGETEKLSRGVLEIDVKEGGKRPR